MVQSAQSSRQLLAILTNHRLVPLLVMHALTQFQVPWAQFLEMMEEELETVITAREEEPEELGEEPTSPASSAGEEEEPEEQEPEEEFVDVTMRDTEVLKEDTVLVETKKEKCLVTPTARVVELEVQMQNLE